MTLSGYHSPLREAQASATRERILDAAGTLIERGLELTYAAIADVAQVQERTVYRHFPAKAELQTAFWKRTNAVQLPLAESAHDVTSLAALIQRSFICIPPKFRAAPTPEAVPRCSRAAIWMTSA